MQNPRTIIHGLLLEMRNNDAIAIHYKSTSGSNNLDYMILYNSSTRDYNVIKKTNNEREQVYFRQNIITIMEQNINEIYKFIEIFDRYGNETSVVYNRYNRSRLPRSSRKDRIN